MSGKAVALIVGLALVVLAICWFVTPLPDVVMQALRPEVDPTSELGPRSARGPAAESTLDFLKVALDAANLLVGMIGVYLTVRSVRTRKARAGT